MKFMQRSKVHPKFITKSQAKKKKNVRQTLRKRKSEIDRMIEEANK